MKIIIIILLILLIIWYCNRKNNFTPDINKYKSIKDIIMLCPVQDEDRFIQLWNTNYEVIRMWKIDIIFVHFDLKVDNWKKQFNYYDEDNVKHIITDGCKSKHWKYLSPLYTNEYEYIWLIDGDMNLKDWNWDIYRRYLKSDDYVSQSAIKPNKKDEHGTHWEELRYRSDKEITTTDFIEQQCCLIKKELWDVMYDKLLYSNNYTSWEIEWYWNEIANKLKTGKHKSSPFDKLKIEKKLLVVHVSPVIHENYKIIQVGNNKCQRKLIRSEYSEHIDTIIKRLLKNK